MRFGRRTIAMHNAGGAFNHADRSIQGVISCHRGQFGFTRVDWLWNAAEFGVLKTTLTRNTIDCGGGSCEGQTAVDKSGTYTETGEGMYADRIRDFTLSRGRVPEKQDSLSVLCHPVSTTDGVQHGLLSRYFMSNNHSTPRAQPVFCNTPCRTSDSLSGRRQRSPRCACQCPGTGLLGNDSRNRIYCQVISPPASMRRGQRRS